jgi:Tol biopolymer transport system component
MVDNPTRLDDATASPLEGWKAVAVYLNRDVRTVKRWEADESLPIHRHQHAARSSVYAFPHELDAWRASRRPTPKRTPQSRVRRTLALAAVLLVALISPGDGHFRKAALSARQAPTEVFRKVWSGAGAIARDGRRVVYIDKNGNLVLHNVATGVERPLTTDASYARSYATVPAISRRGDRAAYWWLNFGGGRDGSPAAEIREVTLDGAPRTRTIVTVNEDAYARDWAPDGRSIAVAGATGISIVSLDDGSRRPVHALTGRGPDAVFFSPDGRFVAFDAPARAVTDPFDVFVAALDGSGTVAAVAHPASDRLMEWSPDGRQLLFSSDRSGSVDLWALPVSSGRPSGDAKMLRRGIGVTRSLGLGSDGSLFMQSSLPDRDIHIVNLDLATGRSTSPAVRPIQQFVGMNEQPSWSRDGKKLAYVSHRDQEPFPIIVIRAEDTGEMKELRPQLPGLRGLDWSPDGDTLVAGGTDLKDNGIMVRIDIASGKVTPVTTPSGGYQAFFPQYSPDGRRIYYNRPVGSTEGFALVERELASGEERELFRADALGGHRVSPDGQFIAVVRSRRDIVIVPVRSGPTRTLFPVAEPDYLGLHQIAWTPDGRAVIAVKQGRSSTGDISRELWLVPLEGTPLRLDVDVRRMPSPAFSGIRLHPSGTRLAFVSDGETRNEVWVLEHFLEALNSKPSLPR